MYVCMHACMYVCTCAYIPHVHMYVHASYTVRIFHMYICMYMLPTLFDSTSSTRLCLLLHSEYVHICKFYLPALYGVFISESVHTEVGVDLDDHGAVVPPHLARVLEVE